MVAQFLMRCLFTMFAEDVELIPKESFSGLLTAYAGSEESRGYLPEALQSLWAVMDTGGFSPERLGQEFRARGVPVWRVRPQTDPATQAYLQ